MLGLEKLFGSDEAAEAAEIEAAAAEEAIKKYAIQAEKARETFTGAEEIGRGDISTGLTTAQAYGEPYRAAGKTSLDAYMASLGLQGKDKQADVINTFQSSPGYKFALDQGIKARDASAAAKGTLMSGGLLKELTAYGQGMASQDYGGWQDRLAKTAEFGGQLGEAAAGREMEAGGALSGLTERTGTRVGGSYTSQGEQEASSTLAAGQARASGKRAEGAAKQSAMGFIGGLAGAALGGPIGGSIGKNLFS